jgi:hypothetical protein
VSLFCRHNRFTADCPICSKGTLLDSGRTSERRPKPKSASARSSRRASDGGARQFSGPHVSAGPYERDEGGDYEVRLERVPGGVRLAEWSHGALEKRAPRLPAGELAALVAAAVEKELFERRDLDALREAFAVEDGHGEDAGDPFGASPGRAGDMREELRVERLDDGRVRIGRWLFWPGRGWELQDAPPMLPVARYAQAMGEAARRGLLRP